MSDLESIYEALVQAQDCIRDETPEDMTRAEAIEDTISKVRDAMRAIEAMQAGGAAQTPTWQPAETAPKDGTEILGLCDWEHNCTVVLFYQSGQWLVRWDHSQFDDGFALTHWMPIPTPPSLVSSTPSEPAQAAASPTAEDIYACCRSTLIGFRDELTEQQIKFICDQIARKSILPSTMQLCPDWRTCKCKDRCAHSSVERK